MSSKRMHTIGALFLLLLSLAASTSASAIVPTLAKAGGVLDRWLPQPVRASDAGGIQINEVVFAPLAGDSEWIELKNVGSTPVGIGGYGLTDEDGHWYRICKSGASSIGPKTVALCQLNGLFILSLILVTLGDSNPEKVNIH